MSNKQNFPNWFLWMFEHAAVLFLVFAIMLLVAGTIAANYIGSRLDEIKGHVASEPPRRYQPPNLEEHKAELPESYAVEKTVYVPIYSHIYYDGGRPHLVEATLSIRNVSLSQPIYIRQANYFNTHGELVKSYLEEPVRVAPLETIELLVEARDSEGGSGSNFLVEWLAAEPVDAPIIEAVMVGMFGRSAFSFVTSGREITGAAQP